MGAVVVTEARDTYYVAGLSEWDASVLRKKVSVTGVVVDKKLAPDPTVGSDGSVSAGMAGTAKVIEKPVWKLAP